MTTTTPRPLTASPRSSEARRRWCARSRLASGSSARIQRGVPGFKQHSQVVFSGRYPGNVTYVLIGSWSRGRAKLKLGIAKGKKAHDKRASIKDRDWKRDQARMLKSS